MQGRRVAKNVKLKPLQLPLQLLLQVSLQLLPL
jgi:hypothetical protein